MRTQQLDSARRSINVRVTKTMPDGTELTGNVESTLGRFIFNEIIATGSGLCRSFHPRQRAEAGS